MKRRPALGADPFDAVVPPLQRQVPPPRSAKSKKVTYELDPDLVEQVKDAVVALSGPPLQLTIAGLVDRALRAEIRKLERTHNGGQAFPKREGKPRTGRPIGS